MRIGWTSPDVPTSDDISSKKCTLILALSPSFGPSPQYTKIVALLALVASTSAFAPAPSARTVTKLFQSYGKYDDKLWDNEAKKDVYNSWDPSQPRSAMNFNPFETWDGNSPDASGFYPGENFYKDPSRGDVNFQQMMVEREEMEQRQANPKPGDVPGAPGCRN
jgi:hypothetical protein